MDREVFFDWLDAMVLSDDSRVYNQVRDELRT